MSGGRTIYRRPSRVPAIGALVLAAVAVAALATWLLIGRTGPAPEDAATAFLAAWSRGDDRRAAGMTDDPSAAAKDLEANREGLDGATLQARLLDLSEEDGTARARAEVTWDVPGIGRFAYRSALTLREGEDHWAVAWAPSVVHPALDEVQRLGTTRTPARRGRILDRDGNALVRLRPVYRVGLARDKVDNVGASARALADVLDVDAAQLTRALRGAGPQQFVEAITLREADYRAVKAALEDVPGGLAVRDEAPLAETRQFARALLGTVGPVTAEQLEQLDGTRGPGDQVGQAGLQQRFERQLGGEATREVVIRAGGVPVETLLTKQGEPGRPLRTTLSLAVQRAAERALGDRTDDAALVAVQPSSGDILAVANRPGDSAYNRAIDGRYPPGSTFKVITTAALLRAGVSPRDVVDCPRTITVGGRSFRNFEGSAAGAVPFATDFAQSCNTAFISLTERLEPGALDAAARDFGLEVPPGGDLVERAASMIGQGRITASPLQMAGVAATVADGRWRKPRLLENDPKEAGPRLDAAERDTLQQLTRAVVTSGTGSALAGIPGDVHGKSGTAEYGSGDPPPTHAWFIAYRDDVAIAVLIENGRSGGSVAAPVAADFFEALG